MSIESTISAVAQTSARAAQESERWISAEKRSSELYGKLKGFRAQVASVFPDGEFEAEIPGSWFAWCPGLPNKVSDFFGPECCRQPDEIEFLIRIDLPTLTDVSLELRVKRDGVGQCLIDIKVPRHRPEKVTIVPVHRTEDMQTEVTREAMKAIRMLNAKGGAEGEVARIEMAEEIFVFAEREFERARPSKK